jgi:hypothetical protein
MPALAALVEAADAATGAGDCRWQFAVEVHVMLRDGASVSLLRSLVRAGLVEHRQEITRPDDQARQFQPLANLSLPERTCLILTDAGMTFACEQLPNLRAAHESTATASTINGRDSSRTTPEWDALRRELRFAGQVVKVYRVPAENQERVLTAFQEAGWPACLADPLPQKPEQNASRRLHETIQKLNRIVHCKVIRFRGDGTGTRICWEIRTIEATQ